MKKYNKVEKVIESKLYVCKQNFYKKVNEDSLEIEKIEFRENKDTDIKDNKKFDFKKFENISLVSREVRGSSFEYCVFENCDFSKINFFECNFRNVLFSSCKFLDTKFFECSFNKEDLVTIFSEKCYFRDVYFNLCDLYSSIFMDVKMDNIYFCDSSLKKSILRMVNINGITFKGSDIRMVKILRPQINNLKFDDYNKITKIDEYFLLDNLIVDVNYKKCYEDVSKIYKVFSRKLYENNLEDMGAEFNYLYKYNKGKSLEGFEKFKMNIFWLLCGFGERPTFVLITSIEIIFIFAIIYMFTGININGVEINYEFLLSEGLFRKDFLKDFLVSVYFSVATFTTVGYGDITPYGFSVFLCSIEMFLGLTLTGLWTVCLSRKIIR
ncbi:MAG: pentapeptide repeat-containing protein [Peptostreptococcaceae bacterium]